jgi:hypothetical protein
MLKAIVKGTAAVVLFAAAACKDTSSSTDGGSCDQANLRVGLWLEATETKSIGARVTVYAGEGLYLDLTASEGQICDVPEGPRDAGVDAPAADAGTPSDAGVPDAGTEDSGCSRTVRRRLSACDVEWPFVLTRVDDGEPLVTALIVDDSGRVLDSAQRRATSPESPTPDAAVPPPDAAPADATAGDAN